MLLFFLTITEILTWRIIRVHYKGRSRTRYYLAMLFNTVLSIFMWMIYFETETWKGEFDDPLQVWLRMNLNGALCAVFVPRILLIVMHFSGVIIKLKKGGHILKLTESAFVLWIIIIAILFNGAFFGRYNVKTEFVSIQKDGLHPDLEGLTVVLVSDLHLAGFYGQEKFLEKQMETINGYAPDIIINAGDFVTYAWREFGRMDTILSGALSKLGNFAVFGNHDMGTYHPEYDYAGRESHMVMMRNLIVKSGYTLLADENTLLKKGNALINIAGITTKGRYGHIKYGNLERALTGNEKADFRMLISHDPSHWKKEVAGKSNVDLTLAGHTHGMQIGIYTKKFRWSPIQFFYPEWNGLYELNGQWLYVNRGLGVLSIPFRLWMPPEITVIKLTGRN